MDLEVARNTWIRPRFRRFHAAPAASISLGTHAPGLQFGAFDLFGDGLYRRKITLADHRESGLNDIHLQAPAAEPPPVFRGGSWSPGALLSVAESGVKDEDRFCSCIVFRSSLFTKKRTPPPAWRWGFGNCHPAKPQPLGCQEAAPAVVEGLVRYARRFVNPCTAAGQC